MKQFYAIACLIGTIIAWTPFTPWVLANGPNLILLNEMAMANAVSSAIWFDLAISAMVTLTLIVAESKRLGITRFWLPMAATSAIGVSCGLPLFLWMRERHLQDQAGPSTTPAGTNSTKRQVILAI